MSYKTQNFLDKNKDFVVAEHQALMEASRHHFAQQLFPADPSAAMVHAAPAIPTPLGQLHLNIIPMLPRNG